MKYNDEDIFLSTYMDLINYKDFPNWKMNTINVDNYKSYENRKDLYGFKENEVYKFLKIRISEFIDICHDIIKNIKDKDEVYKLGRKIYNIIKNRSAFYDSITVMQTCYYFVREYIRVDATVIQYYWDGIGDWRM